MTTEGRREVGAADIRPSKHPLKLSLQRLSSSLDRLWVVSVVPEMRRGVPNKRVIPKSVPWGGTKEAAWRRNDYVVTFRFTSPGYREAFLEEAERLLPAKSWTEVGSSDNDPASRRR